MDDQRRFSQSSTGSEELEYSAQFANRLPKYDSEDEEMADTLGLQSELKTKEPVIFIIGWAGCLEKHLAKYSTMYSKAGVTAVAFRPQFSRFFITPEDMLNINRQAQKFLEITSDLDLEEHPIFFHTFSNNGMAFYSELVELILKSGKYDHLKVCGAVLDSCPGRPHLTTLFRYNMMSSRIDNLSAFQTLLRILCSFFFAIISPLTRLLFGWQQMIFLANRERSEHWPIYYIYSESDRLVPFQDVELSIRKRSNNGLPVGSYRFTDSVHVAHYVKHPEEYAKHCLTFINSCLQQGGNANADY
ncbi:transmembrane protein 53-like [Convolutriloba macropyga]|uniref:transmembrane protein 53-like n=1 Tax=Convolutriloba macropyga TaxID=536237 RepID=UPI003F52139A